MPCLRAAQECHESHSTTRWDICPKGSSASYYTCAIYRHIYWVFVLAGCVSLTTVNSAAACGGTLCAVMRVHVPHGIVARFALWSLVVMLLVSTWPEVQVHNAAASDHPDAAQHVHPGDEAVWGDPEGMHVHACHCAAHCTALPVHEVLTIVCRSTRLPAAEPLRVATGIRIPPFRPPIV